MKNFVQFVKFGLVGILNTLITMAIYYLLVNMEIHYILANLIGYIFGIVNSLIFNSRWVFVEKNLNSNIIKKFILVNISILGLNSLILFIFINQYEINLYFGQLLTIIICLIINFLLTKYWTFKKWDNK